MGDWYPQLSNNVSESLDSILNNVFNRGFVNRAACVEGLNKFYSDRWDKFRVFQDGNKRNKREKSDLMRFDNLKFIAAKFLEIISDPLNHFYPDFLSATFFEAVFKFARVDDPNVNEIYSARFPHPYYRPQIIVTFQN